MAAALPKLPPGDDVVFRRLFDEENDCHLLICLLNAILAYPAGRRISQLTLLRSHVAGPLAEDKEVVLDIRAEAEDGGRYHVELQVSSHPCYSERVLFYWAGMYAGQLEAGQGYGDLRPVVSVHILFFRLFKDKQHAAYHHVFRVRADQDDALLSPQLELHTIEMPKFPDLREGLPGEKWLYWLKYGHEMTKHEVAQLGVPEIIEAERKLAMISHDRQLRVDYERRRMAHHDTVSLRRDSWLQGHGEGKAEGIATGKAEGIATGKAEGIATGKAESLLTLLAGRGLRITPALRKKILACTSLTLLDRWFQAALTAKSAADALRAD